MLFDRRKREIKEAIKQQEEEIAHFEEILEMRRREWASLASSLHGEFPTRDQAEALSDLRDRIEAREKDLANKYQELQRLRESL